MQYLRNNPARRLSYCQSVLGKLGLVAFVVLSLLACTQAVYATTYTIVASVNDPSFGTISPSGNILVNSGEDSPVFTATPTKTGYYLVYFLVDGAQVPGPIYQYHNVTSPNHNIVAVFSNTYHITASAGAGGTIGPAGDTPVNYGGTLAVNIIPNSGNLVSDVLVDGVSVGAVTLYTFNDVSANHTIAATFGSGTHVLTLLFDQSAYKGEVWFQVQDKTQTFKGTYANGGNITFKSPGDMMSDPVKLSVIGAGGLEVSKADGANLFVFYDDPTDNIRTAAPSHMTSQQRFMPFELTMLGNAGDGGDLTAINYFSAPLSLKSYNLDPVQHPGNPALQQAGFGSASTAGIAAPLARASSGNPEAVVKDAKGQIIRYLGPSNFTGANPWPSFVPYTKSIYAANQTTNIQSSNSFNFKFPGFETPLYTFGTDNMIAAADTDGNLTITGRITVSVTGTVKKGTHINPDPPASGYWDLAAFTFNASDVNNFNNAIYGQVVNNAVYFWDAADPTSAWSQFQTFCKSTWMDPNKPYQNDKTQPNYNPSINDVFAGGNAYDTTIGLFIGEVTTGLLGGFFNSDVKVGNVAIKNMASKDWWKLNPMVAFSEIQPVNPFYNLYAGVIFDKSNNTVYGVPYSDRFGNGPLVNSVNYKTTGGVSYYVNYWVVGIGTPLPQAIVSPGMLELLLLDNE